MQNKNETINSSSFQYLRFLPVFFGILLLVFLFFVTFLSEKQREVPDSWLYIGLGLILIGILPELIKELLREKFKEIFQEGNVGYLWVKDEISKKITNSPELFDYIRETADDAISTSQNMGITGAPGAGCSQIEYETKDKIGAQYEGSLSKTASKKTSKNRLTLDQEILKYFSLYPEQSFSFQDLLGKMEINQGKGFDRANLYTLYGETQLTKLQRLRLFGIENVLIENIGNNSYKINEFGKQVAKSF